jgi:hypothetical protein
LHDASDPLDNVAASRWLIVARDLPTRAEVMAGLLPKEVVAEPIGFGWMTPVYLKPLAL